MNNSVIETFGTAATSFEETLKAADLNWEVKADRVAGMDTGIQMPRKKMLYRSDTNAPLGIVGENYSPSDPKIFLQTQYDFAKFMGGKVIRAGFLEERSRAFAFTRVGEMKVVRGKSQKGDLLNIHIYSTDGWDGGTPTKSRLYVERVVCSNGMTSRQLAGSLWAAHTKGLPDVYEERWKKFMGEIQAQMVLIRDQFTKLAEAPMDRKQMNEFLFKLMPGESTMSVNRRSEISGLFAGGVGNEGASRWDAYNAVTEFVTHHRSYRTTDNTPVEVNRFVGVLEKDTLSEKALALLN
jgi:hypothetical protein